MHIELGPLSQAKVEDLLEELATRYDLQDLQPADLIDALLDIGVDLLLAEEAAMPFARARLINYAARKIASR